MFSFFISHFGLKGQPAEYFFSQKIRKMRAGQNNGKITNMILQRPEVSKFQKFPVKIQILNI